MKSVITNNDNICLSCKKCIITEGFEFYGDRGYIVFSCCTDLSLKGKNKGHRTQCKAYISNGDLFWG